jgi:2,5-diamino-6-(ribosylamino)-4(3H)-pyrimidinone 5'-phosphate reductase
MSRDLAVMTGPHVVVHVAVSVDGATTGFDVDLGRFYELAATWNEDVTLAGSDTILAQEQALAAAPRPGPATNGPVLAVVDGRGRVREWDALRTVGHWSGVVALHAESTPLRPAVRSTEEIVVGTDRVDLAGALDALERRYAARVVRVESGGSLVGALLHRGLVDEVSLVVHPLLAGARTRRLWHGSGSAGTEALDLVDSTALDDGLVWLRYRVRRP